MSNDHPKGLTGLLPISDLFALSIDPPSTPEPQVLLSLIAYSQPFDPWSTPSSATAANNLLSKYKTQTQTSAFIIDYILQQIIRPIFSKAKRPEAITSSGRKAIPSSAPPRRFDAAAQDAVNMPWLYEFSYTITVFEWAIQNSTTEIAVPNFNLYLPPLLTLLDSTDTPVRCRALGILSSFLPLLPVKLLRQTGLGSVFEDAVTPTLMFLPSLTPVDESARLLSAAYSSLVQLGTVLYPIPSSGSSEEEGNRGREMEFWDRVMRKGVLAGYAHAGEYPSITVVLVQTMGTIISRMDIYSVKYIKDIIPILSSVLRDPFTPTTDTTLLSSTVSTLQLTIENCWPRLEDERWRVEIVGAIATCYLNLSKSEADFKDIGEDEGTGGVMEQLYVTGRMFVKAIEGDADGLRLRMELEPLFEADQGLRKVFGLVGAG